MSAESNIVSPASRQMSTSRVASVDVARAPGLEELAVTAAERPGAQAQNRHHQPGGAQLSMFHSSIPNSQLPIPRTPN